MGRLRTLSGADVCAILARHGFVEIRRRGSHILMQARDAGTTVTVPVPDRRERKRGTLHSILRQSGLQRHLFEE